MAALIPCILFVKETDTYQGRRRGLVIVNGDDYEDRVQVMVAMAQALD